MLCIWPATTGEKIFVIIKSCIYNHRSSDRFGLAEACSVLVSPLRLLVFVKRIFNVFSLFCAFCLTFAACEIKYFNCPVYILSPNYYYYYYIFLAFNCQNRTCVPQTPNA